MSRDGLDARTLAALLAQRAPSLAAELLPRGQRDGAEWRCGSLAGEVGRSFGMRLTGAKAGLWCDFASGETGDCLDLVAGVLFGGDLGAAMGWARRWLGFGNGTTAPAVPVRRAPATPTEVEGAEVVAKRRKALVLFAEARQHVPGTPDPMADYLAARGLNLAELGRVPRALRYHPACWCGEAGGPLPAMVAAISGPDGTHVATHRTWLARGADGAWFKAKLRDAKRTLGSYAGGAIRLWRGASGKSLDEAEPGETVVLAEGIETGLAIVIAAPELRVLSVVSLSNLARVELPAAISTVIVAGENDGPNEQAARALAKAVDRFAAEGREVRIARPPAGVKDFNDMINLSDSAA